MQEDLLRTLNEVDDPELGIGIVDLGLIYRAEWTETGIEADFTTTVSSCPYAAFLCEQIDTVLRERVRMHGSF
jgi:metal-sulfur cluster biosynthetic enzyme